LTNNVANLTLVNLSSTLVAKNGHFDKGAHNEKDQPKLVAQVAEFVEVS
jgi:hypothetical protein